MMEEIRGDYIVKFDKLLGKGSFGCAYVCYKKDKPQEEFCMKIIKKSEINEQQGDVYKKKQLEREILAIKELRNSDSENLVKLIDLVDLQYELCIVMELCDYDLYQEYNLLRKKQTWFSRSEQIDIIQQILKGAQVLIQNSLVHRDIKPQNILVKVINKGQANQRKIYKLADFGFTRALDDIYKKANLTRVGTIVYCAPEILKNQQFSAKCDIFSYGVVFHQLVFDSQFPGNYHTQQQMHDFIAKLEKQPFKCKKLDGEFGDNITQLIENMLLFDQDKRISFEELFSHEINTKIIRQTPDSLFLDFSRKFDKEEIEKQIIANQQSKYDKIYQILDIFFRKSKLCQSVIKYMKNNIIVIQTENLLFQQLIEMIGLEEIKFGFALLHFIVSDFSTFIRNNHDIPNLITVLQSYLQYSKKSEKDQTLHKKINLEFYDQQKQLQDDYNALQLHLQQQKIQIQFQPVNDYLQACQIKKVDILKCCRLLDDLLSSQIINQQITRWDQKIQQNIQSIKRIETKFQIERYFFLNPNEIFDDQN